MVRRGDPPLANPALTLLNVGQKGAGGLSPQKKTRLIQTSPGDPVCVVSEGFAEGWAGDPVLVSGACGDTAWGFWVSPP